MKHKFEREFLPKNIPHVPNVNNIVMFFSILLT